uniref:NADH-ubiquinone oxidoreductase chain 6 n=1 Tax=Oreophryne sp. TNHC-GDC 18615 TaxID=1933078 RepID=A0A343VTF4_9NEOB|nr:NADH dehydrogenase subunit 6 [Oreophryne sp. TNHC-GDC 18615]
MTVFELVLLAGVLGVAWNPSPYYGALGLVLGAGGGCLLLMEGGMTFLCLVLFIIYLGGMMVVFAYTAALVGEPYPKGWDYRWVLNYLVVYAVVLVTGLAMWWAGCGGEYNEGWDGVLWEWWGVSIIYSEGGWVLLLGSWALLVTLVGVVEVVWGRYSGSLRAL